MHCWIRCRFVLISPSSDTTVSRPALHAPARTCARQFVWNMGLELTTTPVSFTLFPSKVWQFINFALSLQVNLIISFSRPKFSPTHSPHYQEFYRLYLLWLACQYGRIHAPSLHNGDRSLKISLRFFVTCTSRKLTQVPHTCSENPSPETPTIQSSQGWGYSVRITDLLASWKGQGQIQAFEMHLLAQHKDMWTTLPSSSRGCPGIFDSLYGCLCIFTYL